MLLAQKLLAGGGGLRINDVLFNQESYGYFNFGSYFSTVTINADGALRSGDSWISDTDGLPASAALYEVIAQSVEGDGVTASSSPLNTWISVDEEPSWTIGTFGTNYSSGTLSIQIRQKSNFANTDTAEFILTASYGF